MSYSNHLSATVLRATAPLALRAIRGLAITALGVCATSVTVLAQAVLSDQSKQVVDMLRQKGSSTAKVMLAVDPARTGKIARALLKIGGEIRVEQDEVGYLRVLLPMAELDKAIKLAGVQLVEPYYREGSEERARVAKVVDEMRKYSASQPDFSLPPNLPDPPAPYVTHDLIGVARLRAISPQFDGRGVTIAIVEKPGLLTHPELRSARTIDGRHVPKFLDVVPASLPLDGVDTWWVDMATTVSAPEGTFVFQGDTYHAPRVGSFHIGVFTDDLAGKLAANARGAKATDPRFTVLWDAGTNTVWVDTNQNHDFSDEQALAEYAERQEFGFFGIVSGALDQKVAFTIHIAHEWSAVHIALCAANHGTMTASTAAGSKDDGGLFDGVAPGARIIAYDAIGAANYVPEYAYTEALIRAISDPRVDVVSVSLGFGSDLANTVMARASRLYGKPVVYAGLLRTLPPVITAAMYMDRETLRRNRGITGERNEFIVGPKFTLPDGRLVPDALGPVNSLAASSSIDDLQARPRWFSGDWLKLPLGYSIGGGSSQATPMIAGMLATIMSAARQNHIPADLPRLIAALRTGSRWVSEVEGSNKSARLPQADQVWLALERLAKTAAPEISVSAPIVRFGALPVTGIGVVDEHGVVGVERNYRVSLVRHSGPEDPVAYKLRWLGNDNASFSAAETVLLPKNQTVVFTTQGQPRSVGVRTAILELIDPATNIVVEQVPHTLVVPLTLIGDGSQPVIHKVLIEQHGDREIEIPSSKEGRVIQVEIASSDQHLSCLLQAPSGGFTVMEHIPRGLASAAHPHQWEKLTDVSELGITKGYGFRFSIADTPKGLWRLLLRREGQPDILPPHTHTPEDMKAIPVIIRIGSVAEQH